MPELVINVPKYIGESYMDWETYEWVQGITWGDIEMQMWWAEAMGEAADSILLNIGVCEGGSTIEGFNIYNKLRDLGLPIRSRVMGVAASMAVPIALAADEAPEMDYTAQLMIHSAAFYGGVNVETSHELRAQADRLDNTNQLLQDLFVARSNQPLDVVQGWFAKDTWLTATQAQAVGLCSKVIPLATTTTIKAADTLITARRRKLAAAINRVGKHALAARTTPTPKAKTKAARAAAATPRPMATTKKPAAKPTAKTATLPAAKAANIAAVKAFAEQLGVTITAEGDAPEAVVEHTILADGAGHLYHNGPLAVDSAVFNDEALTVPTADAEYEAEDGRVITVAGGIITDIADAEAEAAADEEEAPTATAAITAAVTAALAPFTERLNGIEAKFNKAVPPLPRKAATAQLADGKTPRPKAAHHTQL